MFGQASALAHDWLSGPSWTNASQLHLVLGSSADLDDLAKRLASQHQPVLQIGSQDGLAELNVQLQRAVALAGHRFDALHVYGHAGMADLQVGRDRLTGQSLSRHASDLAALGSALTPQGDLLVYGCDLAAGQQGAQFVNRLAAMTGADVAASDDLTGSPNGGPSPKADWTLEVHSGALETAPIAGADLGWSGRLGQLQEPVRLQSVNGVLDVTLRATRGSQMIEVADPSDPLKPGTPTKVDGFMTYAWTLNQGRSSTNLSQGNNEQGPTLQVNPGELLRIRLENDLGDQPTNLHTHGLVINPSGNADNVLLSVPAGYANQYEYRIPKDQEPGVNWYHPHNHMYAAEQVYRGLAGFLVIGHGNNDIEEIKSMPFRMMMIQAQTIGKDAKGNPLLLPLGNVDSTDSATSKGGRFQMTVNGQYLPDINFTNDYEAWVQLQINPRDLVRTFQPRADKAKAAVKDWKFADLSNYKSYYAAQDGEAFPTTVGKTRVSLEPGGSDEQALKLLRERNGGFATALAPGKRVTEIITAPPANGYHYFAATAIQPGSNRQSVNPLARLRGFKQGGNDERWSDQPLTSATRQFVDLSNEPVDVVRDITFETKPGQNGAATEFMINGRIFPDAPVLQPRAGQVEEWRVTNKDKFPHPIHLHMQTFQAEAVSIGQNGYTIPPHYYDSDVWYMDPGSTSVFRIRWTPTLGESVYHCHNFFHEDGGMMALLNVIPAQPQLVVSEAGGQGRIGFYSLEGGSSQSLLSSPLQIVSPFDTFDNTTPIRYTGGINTVMGDVNADGVPDAVVAQHKGGGVMVLDGSKKYYRDNLREIFYPFGKDPGFALNVAAADVNGDTQADIIVAGGEGADGRVKVFSGATKELLADFKAVTTPGYKGGLSLTTGNVDGSGRQRIVTAPASAAAPELSIWGWDLFTKLQAAQSPASKTSAAASTHNHAAPAAAASAAPAAATASTAGLLGLPQLKARVLAGDANDRRGLTLTTTYYGADKGGFRRIVTAPASNADRATLWQLQLDAHAAHGTTAPAAATTPATLAKLTEFRPAGQALAKAGFSLASVSTPVGSVVALAPNDGSGPITTFLPKVPGSFAPSQQVFKPITVTSGRLSGS